MLVTHGPFAQWRQSIRPGKPIRDVSPLSPPTTGACQNHQPIDGNDD